MWKRKPGGCANPCPSGALRPMPNLPDAQAETPEAAKRRFRLTLVKVMTVQVITLILLWLLQSRYHG